MHRAKDYLKRAEEAEAVARKMMAGDQRRQMLEIADQWRNLARQAQSLARDEPESGATDE